MTRILAERMGEAAHWSSTASWAKLVRKHEMSTPRIQPLNREELRRQFREAEPFPFVAIDGFLDPAFAREVAAAYPDYAEATGPGAGVQCSQREA